MLCLSITRALASWVLGLQPCLMMPGNIRFEENYYTCSSLCTVLLCAIETSESFPIVFLFKLTFGGLPVWGGHSGARSAVKSMLPSVELCPSAVGAQAHPSQLAHNLDNQCRTMQSLAI
jgi:hypothetical protein